MLTETERNDLVLWMSSLPLASLYGKLAEAQAGSPGYEKENVEAAIREKFDLVLFNNGWAVRLDFPSDTSLGVRERVVQIHAEVCASWGCDSSGAKIQKA